MNRTCHVGLSEEQLSVNNGSRWIELTCNEQLTEVNVATSNLFWAKAGFFQLIRVYVDLFDIVVSLYALSFSVWIEWPSDT